MLTECRTDTADEVRALARRTKGVPKTPVVRLAVKAKLPEPEPEPAPQPAPRPKPVLTYAGPVLARFAEVPDVIDTPAESNPLLRVSAIAVACANYYGVTVKELKAHQRITRIVRPRQVAMYLAKTLTPRSLPEIARLMGGFDHTTVLHSTNKIGRVLESNEQLQEDIAAIKRSLGLSEAGEREREAGSGFQNTGEGKCSDRHT